MHLNFLPALLFQDDLHKQPVNRAHNNFNYEVQFDLILRFPNSWSLPWTQDGLTILLARIFIYMTVFD